MALSEEHIEALLRSWREDAGSTYRSWFLWEDRLKNFRSIRAGVAKVIEEIEANAFGNAYRGSSLETVVGSIAEQRQIFKGADHAFLWKPKLRIPDIYESQQNQAFFGRFLKRCSCCTDAGEVIKAIRELDFCRIKGLGPAAANLLYFLHPTIMPPFNTAIVKGYNALTNSKVKLGRWEEYLAMRSGILRFNDIYRKFLSNDLGAIAGLLFDIGSGRYLLPINAGNPGTVEQWEEDLRKVREESLISRKIIESANRDEQTHTQVQEWLRNLGISLGFNVWIASNDRNRITESGFLGDACLKQLPEKVWKLKQFDTIRLIDVLWLTDDGDISAAFEVEHSTSIYSGIMRLLDLALSDTNHLIPELFLVAPDEREEEVKKQLIRPAFRQISQIAVKYIPYTELAMNRTAIEKFGHGLKPLLAISKIL